MVPNPQFWQGKRVLLTGHTGFKGAWLALWLQNLGAEVLGISLPPVSSQNLFHLIGSASLVSRHYELDIKDAQELKKITQDFVPQIVFHLAAQSLVRPGYKEPLKTFSTNIMGTANLLESLRDIQEVRAVVMVTTDKVYLNQEWDYPYRESDTLGGYDPYSASKAASEIVISSYRQSFLNAQGVAVGVARAGNVIGGGDWSEDRLIPDAIKAWQHGKVLDIRSPESIRPWQHVLDSLAAYLLFVEQLWINSSLGQAFNFGPPPIEFASVRKVILLAREIFEKGEIDFSQIPLGPHEANILKLEIAKAQSLLNFRPNWGLYESVARTMYWYRAHLNGGNAKELCLADIEAYIRAANE